MSNIEFRFDTPWLLLLYLPLACVVIYSTIKTPQTQKGPLFKSIPLVLRLLAMLMVTLLMTGFTIITNHADTALLIAADTSDSMNPARDQVLQVAQQIIDGAPDSMWTGVMAFAGRGEMTQNFSKNLQNIDIENDTPATATNLANALQSAMAFFPEHTIQRIVLLTDGQFTDGNTMTAVADLANKNIRMDAIAFDTQLQGPEVAVTAFEIPADAALGTMIRARITVRSNTDGSGHLSIFDGEQILWEKDMNYHAGENIIQQSIKPTVPGTRVLKAVVSTEQDTWEENNCFYDTIQITTSNKILLVDGSGQESAALEELLRSVDYDVTVTSCEMFPKTIAGLCEYSLIVLMNVNVSDLPNFSDEHLRDYVQIYGRSLLTTGGQQTYINGGMQGTPLEDVLPVSMIVQDRESEKPVAELLMIDNSASMYGTAITMAKNGAIKSISALNDNDYAGVITFSVEYGILSPLTTMDQREKIISSIAPLGTVMGTQYTQALLAAQEQMDAVDEAVLKHVILISDGYPADSGYEHIIQEMHEDGVAFSVIAVKSQNNGVNVELMQQLAELGGGTFYLVNSSFDLPSIMLSDTIQLQVSYLCEGSFPTQIEKRLFNVKKLPAVNGYVRASLKPSADLVLKTDQNHPLYAQWESGYGMAGSFMTDLSGQWSKNWFLSDEGRSYLTQLFSQLLRDEHMNEAVKVSIESGGSDCAICVQTADERQDLRFSAQIETPGGKYYQRQLLHRGNGRYEASIPLDGFGKYNVNLEMRDAKGEALDQISTAAAISWSPEYDTFSMQDSELLKTVCEMTGGAVYTDVQEVLSVNTGDLFVVLHPDYVLATIAFFAMMLDLVIRKTRLRRTTMLFCRLFRKL